MRAVVQRVKQAKVSIGEETVGQIDKGMMVLLGVTQEDGVKDVDYLVNKICNLRIFSDTQGKMNLSLKEIAGQMLVVSQFTLYGDCRKGRRPSFVNAAPPQKARELYDEFVQKARLEGMEVATGRFQEDMLVEIHNDGPVTLILDSEGQI